MKQAIDKLQEVITFLSTQPKQSANIGIGITTRNRYEVFKKSLAEIIRLSPGFKIVVVDDASTVPVPEATFRFETNVGIAQAKNKCFELLEDCDHIFLIDDDTYPVKENWYLPYIESGHAHLMYIFKDFATGRKINDSVILYQNSKIIAWSHPRGCMLYYRKECLQKVGGMNPIFGKWGWEHVNLSERIYYAGLNQFKYADVANSKGLFYSGDEHERVTSTVIGPDRVEQINKNRPVYESLKGKGDFIPYKQRRNILLTAYFTTVGDPQRSNMWEPNINDLKPLWESIEDLDLIVLHDCFIDSYDTKGIDFIKVETSINPYFQRWISYRDYLMKNRESIDKVFCVDATDVEMLQDPFPKMQPGKIYVGDEHEFLACQWMQNHHKQPDLVRWMSENPYLILLNAGLLGGLVDDIIAFISHIIDFYFTAKQEANHNKPDAGATDMAVFNYVARTKFCGKIEHGQMVNTKFKANEKNNNISWFKHK